MKTDQYDSLIAATDWLQQRDQPVSITLTEPLEPSGGPGAVIFPPTYAREPGKIPHPYAISTLRDDLAPEAAAAQGCEANICDLDTVGSQANRMEPAFAEPPLSSLVPQRVIRAGSTSVNLLEIGHRVADGAVRFSALSDLAAKAIAAFGIENDASALARLAPTSLLFGFWDSRDTMLRFPRIVASTIRATNVAALNRSAQFNPAFDPSEIKLTEMDQSAPPHDDKDPLSQQGLRSAPAVDTHGGVRVFGQITRRTEINLVAIRSIAAVKAGKVDPTETIKLRRYLFGLSLVAGRVQSAYNLRQGCLLVPSSGSSATAQIVLPSGQRQAFVWEFADSCSYAQAAAKDFGVWSKDGCAESFDFEPIKVKTAIQSKSEEKAAKKAAKAGKKAGAGFNSVPVA